MSKALSQTTPNSAPSFYGTDKASAEWRSQQADVDADIEGLARDPVADKLVAEWDAADVPLDEQRTRLIAYFRSKEPSPAFAAE